MSENKYQFKGTQRAWEYLQGDDNVNDTERISGSIVGGPDRYYLARIWNDIEGGEALAEPNAHLMAAAPDLLEYAVMAIVHTKGAANSSKVIGLNGNVLYEGVSHRCVKFIENYKTAAIHKALNIQE